MIFDWVPAHFARDMHGLAMFDGAPLFEPEDPARAVPPAWETGVFDFAKPEVRSFLLSSAIHWIEAFHADGLRIDGVESILYRDHEAGLENQAGIAFLRELTSTLKTEHPEVILAAEDSSAWPGVTRAASAGGLGFDLKWDMGFAHDMRRYLAIDPVQRSHHQGLLTFRSVYGSTESFLHPALARRRHRRTGRLAARADARRSVAEARAISGSSMRRRGPSPARNSSSWATSSRSRAHGTMIAASTG